MSGRKNRLKYQNFTSASMATSLTSPVTSVEFLDNIGIQLNFTTADAVGAFAVEISADYQQDTEGNVTNAGNWIPLTLSPSPAAAGASSQIYIDITQTSSPWMRVTYTRTSGTGTLNGWIVGKQI
jgi:hypothetical protein